MSAPDLVRPAPGGFFRPGPPSYHHPGTSRAGQEALSALQTTLQARGRPLAALLNWTRQLALYGDPFVAVGAIWLILLYIQNSSQTIIGIDGYYHIRMAWLMAREGIGLEFPWLPLTILNPRDFTNHHLLYHILLIPFTIGDLRLGAKAAGLVYGVVAVFTVYWVLTRLRVKLPLIWLTVLLAAGEWFLARQSMTRRQSVALALLVLAVYFMITRRYRLLAPVAFAYALLFDGFVLLLGICVVALGAQLVAARRLDLPLLGWTSLGLALAVLLNPYYPNNVVFTYLHILPKIAPDGVVRVGTEWYPYPYDVLMRTSWLAVLLVPAGFLAALLSPRRVLRDPAALLLGGVALTFLVLYLRSRRFIETEPAFALLFAAYMWTHHQPHWRGRPVWQYLPPTVLGALVGVVLTGLVIQTANTVREAAQNVRDNGPYTTFQAPLDFVARNSAPGERVYQTDWDDFPEMFFWNTHNTYIVGLDPTYMYLENPRLYLLWRSIGRGEVALPGQAIRDLFQSHWVVTDKDHRDFIEHASKDPSMSVVFETDRAMVYRVD